MREKVLTLTTNKERYCIATGFLTVICVFLIITGTCVTISRQWELDKVHQKIEGLQQSGGCGIEHLDKLTQCQNERTKLIEMRGRCSAYRELTGNNSAVAAKHDEIKEILKDRVSQEAQSHSKCKDDWRSAQVEVRQLEKTNMDLLLEKEKISSKYMKCDEELTKCNQNLKQ